MIFPKEAVLALEVGNVAFDLLDLASLTHKLRQLIEKEEVFDFSRWRPEKVSVSKESKEFTSTSLPSVESLVSSFAEKEAKTQLISEVLARHSQRKAEDLKSLRVRVGAWQKVISQWRDNLFSFSKEELTDYQRKIKEEKKRLSLLQKEKESYKERLSELLKDHKKRQRYSEVFWSEKNAPQQARKAADLFLETALAVNFARVLHRLHDPGGEKKGGPLDLLAAREKAAELRKRADSIKEKPSLEKKSKNNLKD